MITIDLDTYIDILDIRMGKLYEDRNNAVTLQNYSLAANLSRKIDGLSTARYIAIKSCEWAVGECNSSDAHR